MSLMNIIESALGNEFHNIMTSDYMKQLRNLESTYFSTFFRANVAKFSDKYEISCELPGLSKENIDIEVLPDDILEIRATKTVSSVSTHMLIQERLEGKMSRQFKLSRIDSSQIKAKFENGVLYVTVPTSKTSDKLPITIE